MQRCVFQWVDDQHLVVSGAIDENFSFEEQVARFPDELWLDLSGVTRINSCGLREWIKSILKTTAKLHFVNCASVVVSQFAMIPEFIGKNGQVDSFETNYACDHCGHQASKILIVGKDILPGCDLYDEAPELSCSECSKPMSCDHSPEVYFSFLSEAS